MYLDIRPIQLHKCTKCARAFVCASYPQIVETVDECGKIIEQTYVRFSNTVESVETCGKHCGGSKPTAARHLRLCPQFHITTTTAKYISILIKKDKLKREKRKTMTCHSLSFSDQALARLAITDVSRETKEGFMTCYQPLTGYWYKGINPETGKRPQVRFRPPAPASMDNYDVIDVPCGRCVGCRLDHSRMWALRCQHEASLHDKNCMVTLTYNDEYLPDDGELRPDDFTKFMKRLRKAVEPDTVRFFGCGEYGTKNDRPHYHACIFGWRPDDLQFWQTTKAGSRIYRSPLLERLWPFGFSSLGDVNWQSAAYVARYNLKKQQNDYSNHSVKPFVRMSRRPGIGAEWFEQHKEHIYDRDLLSLYKQRHGCIYHEADLKVPRYYDKLMEEQRPDLMAEVKAKRLEERSDPHYEFLGDSEIVKEAQVSFLKRDGV